MFGSYRFPVSFTRFPAGHGTDYLKGFFIQVRTAVVTFFDFYMGEVTVFFYYETYSDVSIMVGSYCGSGPIYRALCRFSPEVCCQAGCSSGKLRHFIHVAINRLNSFVRNLSAGRSFVFVSFEYKRGAILYRNRVVPLLCRFPAGHGLQYSYCFFI